jgi:nicotinate-nucleotide adenylyltransferase
MRHLPAHRPIAPRRVILLAGSFDPPHAGHLHISQMAQKLTGIRHVWWLVSPQNPQKSHRAAPLKTRLAKARALTKHHPTIHAWSPESHWPSPYTVDSLKNLQQQFPTTRFIWLMGADNLLTFHRWKHWQTIAHTIPLLVLARAPYYTPALRAKAAQRFAKHRTSPQKLARKKPPAWAFAATRPHPASSTALRAK